ncbi:MAG TPA: pantetheine-phosphate adenylyltransferase [Microbacteriaceae bacterium]|nr:pantetheine-phosphate adenylyltransferase [Microbacteriaceae bacterium]
MARIAVVPGSFDPITLGHLDVVRRAAPLVDELHVVVVHNPGKTSMIPAAERVRLIEQSLREVGAPSNVRVASWSMGLLVDYCLEVGANMLIKGIRSEVDVSYETPMALVNRNLAQVETLFMLPNPEHAHVSSSLVRQVAGLGGDVRPYVPKVVADFLGQSRPE